MAKKESEKVKKAMENYEVLTGDKEVERLAEIRLMSELEEKSALASARDKGEKIGREQGEKIGKEKTAKELLKLDMSIGQIMQVTGLTEEDIIKIKKQTKST